MELPLLLAGPILRRVQPRAAAVWVAFSRPATVSLLLWEGLRKSATPVAPIARSPAVRALRIGERLYIAVAVAERQSPAVPLQPGVNYAYDLELKVDGETKTRTLASEGLLGRFDAAGLAADAWVSHEPLGYAAGLLPSFSLPPALLTDLRIVYGSCRRVANSHFDAMPWIDTLINEAFNGQTRAEGAPLGTAANERPHQLFLGGDQIYADDLSPLHLILCNRLAHQMLSGERGAASDTVEELHAAGALEPAGSGEPFIESLLLRRAPKRNGDALDLTQRTYPATLSNFPADGRYELTLADARFTSVDGASHLLSFGEFAAMYVSVYTDWFWTGVKAMPGSWRGLDDVTIDGATRAPDAPVLADEVPLFCQSLLDTKVAAYFDGGRWTGWNGMRPRPPEPAQTPELALPPDKLVTRNAKKFDACFARFMLIRLARPDVRTGFDGFRELIGDPAYLAQLTPALRNELSPETVEAMEDLSRKNASVFRTLMKQLQGRVMRGLIARFGIAKVAQLEGDTLKVLQQGPVAIEAEKRKRKQDYDDKKADAWCQHLDNLIEQLVEPPLPKDWKTFVTKCLSNVQPRPWLVPEAPSLVPEITPPKKAADIADAPLDATLIDRLSDLTKWADDPESDQRAAFDEAGYINLSRTMIARCIAEFAGDKIWPVYASLHGQRRNLEKFALGQAKVRRALANVPTYMIFDDHDVTDDWNLNPEWCRRVLAADAARPQPLGRQVIRNALASYALFQDWGNDFVRYASGAPGSQVLAQIERLFTPPAGPWPQAAAARELDRLFGLDLLPQPVDPTRPRGRHAAADPPMKWHYTVEGPQFTVAVLDNRTRRGFASIFGPPGNVGTTMIDDQVPSAPLPAGHEVLIVVAPLQVLAPSVFDEIVAPGAYRAFDLGSPSKIGVGRGGEAMPGLNPDAIESWALDAITFEALTARLAPHRKVVLLSGDVHNSTATQLSYWRKGQAEPARILQFVSSGFKNVMPSYLTLIDQSMAFAQELIRVDLGGDRMGWLDGADGAFTFPPGKSEHDVPLVLRKRIQQRPAHLPAHGWPADASRPETDPAARTRVRADKRPDFSWTLRPIFDTRPDTEPTTRPVMARPVPLSGTPPTLAAFEAKGESAFRAYAQVATRHFRQLDRLSHSRQILFRSNLGVVRFEAEGARRFAVHQVITVLPDPLNRADTPHLLKPEVVMEQRGELTPPAGAVRPEDRPLGASLGTSLKDKLRTLGG